MIWSLIRRHLLFVVIVAIPTTCSIIYFGVIASDAYISESRFVVSSAQGGAPAGGVASLLMGATGSHAHADSYEVRDFILSRDALHELTRRLKIEDIFGRPDTSFIDRYPGLIYDKSFEELFRYYTRHVEVELDSGSTISVLTVKAYSAEDARRINAELLDMSERLVNRLNERSRHDMIGFAQGEVNAASEKAKEAAMALFSYRSDQTVFEPNKQATQQLEIVGKVHQELITTEEEIAQLKKLSPDNPQIGALEGTADLLRKTIASETGKVTSPSGSFSSRAPVFQRLELDVEFADKQLAGALAELATARSDAQKQQIYLERLTEPSVQDKSMEPRRIRSMITTFIISLLAWGVASILIASVREHAD
jgi:capsular polysaccharide transport system permease protein